MAWRMLSMGSGVLAGLAAEKGLTLAWRTATGSQPPGNPEDPDTRWTEAVSWALLSGAVIGLSRLVAARQAAKYYRRSSGHLPKALRPPS